MHYKMQINEVNGFKSLHIQKDSPISLILFLIKNGSRHENAENSGISHFIEHMMFKQTQNRSTSNIAIEIETLGGHANAFTSYEFTGYYIQVIENNFEKSFEILSDIFQNGKFEEKDIDIERGNIIEEINMYQDSPIDLVWQYAHANIFPNNSLGRPIIGTAENVSKFSRNDLLKYLETNYLQEDILIVTIGKFDYEKVKNNIEKNLKQRKPGKLSIQKAEFKPKEKINLHLKEDSSQSHVVMSFKGVNTFHEDIYKYYILQEILGGGMGSMLFSLLREKLGVAYYVGASHSDYEDTGSFHIYFGANFDKTKLTIDKIFEALEDLKNKGISEHDLLRAKNYYFSSIAMAHENVSYLGEHYGTEYLIKKKIEQLPEVKEKVYAITADDIKNIANKIFNDDYNITYIANKKLI